MLDKEGWLEELRVEAVNRNRKHGLRISDSDSAFQCVRIAETRPKERLVGIQKELAHRFGFHQRGCLKLLVAWFRGVGLLEML